MIQDSLDCNRLLCAKLIIVAGLAWGITYTRKMWNSARSCPRAPICQNLPQLPNESVLYPILLALLAAIALTPRPVLPAFAFVTLIAALCAHDWTRLRPWVYQNSFMLVAIGVCNGGGATQQEALNVCRLITVSIYFWAGVLKLNAIFFKVAFPWIIQPLLTRLRPNIQGPIMSLGYAVPLIEAGFAIGLLFPKFRMASLLAAVVMHCLILLCFSRLGHKSHGTIWPWNFSMMLTSISLFWKTDQVHAVDILVGQHSLFHLTILLVFTIMPSLGLFNLLDPVFSHGHMSGRHVLAGISLTGRLYEKLPAGIQTHCHQFGWGEGKIYWLGLSEWYQSELRVPPPQQERLLKGIARNFRRYGATQDDLDLTVCRMPGFFSKAYPQVVIPGAELFSGGSNLMPI